MNWDRLQDAWTHSTNADPAPRVDPRELTRRERANRRQLQRRDALETFVALVMLPLFGYETFDAVRDGAWVAVAGALLLTVLCAFVPWRLHRVRALLPQPSPELSTLEYLRHEHAALEAQRRLLEGIIGWYLGPAAIGVLLFFGGLNGPGPTTAIYTLAVLVSYGLLYRANRWAERCRFQPMLERIDRQIKDLEAEQ